MTSRNNQNSNLSPQSNKLYQTYQAEILQDKLTNDLTNLEKVIHILSSTLPSLCENTLELLQVISD